MVACALSTASLAVAVASCSSSDGVGVNGTTGDASTEERPADPGDAFMEAAAPAADAADASTEASPPACADRATTCAGRCGTVVAACGDSFVCDDCVAPARCAVATGLCECNDIHACSGDRCGSVVDACGKTVNCGNCTAPEQCGGGDDAGSPGELRNVCSCPTSFDACAGKCGSFFQCGRWQYCGGCPGQEICGGDHVCGGCLPSTCRAFDGDCGNKPDGCGGTLNCGLCANPNTCGGFGEANKCGGCIYLGMGGSCPAANPSQWSCQSPPPGTSRIGCLDYGALQNNLWCCK